MWGRILPRFSRQTAQPLYRAGRVHQQSKNLLNGYQRRAYPATGPTKEKATRAGPINWTSVGVLIVVGGALAYYFNQEKQKKFAKQNEVQQKKTVGRTAIGGSFELKDIDGKTVTDKDLHGKWPLIYFGFTHCPDVCPDELEKISKAVEIVKTLPGAHGHELLPVFISIDPKRDTPAVIKSYLEDFHKDFIGLRGDEEQTKAVTRAYRVYYVTPEPDPNDPDDYLVDHSIISYLVDPSGNFTSFFGQTTTATVMAHKIAGFMKTYDAENKS
eukprot:Clim_evm23s147 gene=Clim_evmTU23s147